MPKVSLIVRTKNEERWIKLCLKSIFSQQYTDFEVIIVDNESVDGTLKKISDFPVKSIINISDYWPGKALNMGIREGTGEFLVFLSGHCLPENDKWLTNLLSGFKNNEVAGVYGRQRPMSFSSAQTKRDLLISFGLDRRVQEKDSFFHNANSAVRRSVWEDNSFDENATNIEDRIWAESVIRRGYKICYEPLASVFHHHGIHHDDAEHRVASTVQIIDSKFQSEKFGTLKRTDLRIVAIIPVKGRNLSYRNKPILNYTIEYSKNCDAIDEIVVLTDDAEVAEYSRARGVSVPLMRDQKDSLEYVDLAQVYATYIDQIEHSGIHPDLVVSLEPTYVFRPEGLIDKMVHLTLNAGYDSVLPVFKEYNPAWISKDGQNQRIDTDFPRELKSPVLVSAKGLGLVTHPEFLRSGELIGEKCGLFEIKRQFGGLEIRDEEDIELMGDLGLR